MTRLCIAILLSASIASVAIAETRPCRPKRHAKVPAVKGLTYHKARKKLLDAGWSPRQTKDPATLSDDPDLASGNGKEFWQRGYVELDSCAGTGEAPCAFDFTDRFGNHLRVVTIGEESPDARAYATVKDAFFECEK